MIFHIDPDSGAITLEKILDRETAGWHNITVRAVEAGTSLLTGCRIMWYYLLIADRRL